MKKTLFFLAACILVVAGWVVTSCTKEGPQGPPGDDGTETCKQCHSATVVDKVGVEFQMSKHSWGETAFEESGSTTCGTCHVQKAFIYVCQNNIPSTFTLNSSTGKYVNDYSSAFSDAIGEIGCATCHSSLHTTFGYSDITALTTTAPVSMTMWGGAKTIDLTQDNSKSNLCVKCHQPRPIVCNAPTTAATNSRLLSYDSLVNFPNLVMFDSAAPANNKWVKPSYRMHVHYGGVGAIYAGKGAVEFQGSLPYTSSAHTTLASCQDCHMATPMYGVAGGHAFNCRNALESALAIGGSTPTTFNFNGCNATGCHSNDPITLTSAKFANTRATVKRLLESLAAKINAAGGGQDILHSESDPSSNLWAGITAGNYDGYLDIYSSSTNPGGYWRDPYGSGTTNAAKPQFPSLKMVQVGAIINFQLCLREYSLGIHNTQYSTAVLTNTIAALDAAGL